MNTTWRFYIGEDGLWQWEELRPDRVVIRRSTTSYERYEECLTGAKRAGYVFSPAQEKSPRSTSIRKSA
jgi:hypothetical protein